ncbi:hypothetical protein FGRMN_8699 [Fusarium graminum]|nr:hypothetical protein FGRMN_8699 [Fusarium graminum]
MDPPFPGDGQPSSYTNTIPGHGQQSPCLSELTGMESYYALSSGPQDQSPHLSSTGPLSLGSTLSQRQDNQQQLSHPTHDATAYNSMSSGFHYPPRSHHQVWPSPPPGPDDYDNYSYQSSPSSGSAPMSCYNPSPISPRTWSSPDFPLSQPSESIHQQSQQNPYHNLRICTPTSIEGYPVRGPRVLTPFTGSCMHQGFDNEIDGLPHNYSPTTIPSSSAGALSCTSSPKQPLLGAPMHMEAKRKLSPGEPEYPASPDEQLDAKDCKGEAVGAKTEEPYAKLLYRALMSAPEYAMTLQEIYQWFRENTDKDVKKENTPKRPGKNAEGWQNSIRHNLSMNKAFVKRGSQQDTGSAPNAAGQGSGSGAGLGTAKAGEPKKATEWKLVDWAIRNGVESTTKYRPKNPPRRVVGSRLKLSHRSIWAKGRLLSDQAENAWASIRARGEHATNIPPYQYHGTPSPHATDDSDAEHVSVTSPAGLRRHDDATDGDNATNDDQAGVHSNDTRFYSSASAGNVNGNDTTAYALPTGGHQPQQGMYVGSSPCEYPYGMVDVTGVYQGAGHNTTSGGVNERLLGIGPNAVYNWNGQAL